MFVGFETFVHNQHIKIHMQSQESGTKHYYGEHGDYLSEHAQFLSDADVEKDVAFLVKALDLNKNQQILDIACGQGRHVHALARHGYCVDGVDFSSHLLNLAKESMNQNLICTPNFFQSDVMELALEKKYDCAYWFFSDLANINLSKALGSIGENIVVGGSFLLDTDNVFRLTNHLEKHPDSDLVFNAERSELIDASHGLVVPYPTFEMWKELFSQAGFFIEQIYGDYQFGGYSTSSPRLIIVAKKIHSI